MKYVDMTTEQVFRAKFIPEIRNEDGAQVDASNLDMSDLVNDLNITHSIRIAVAGVNLTIPGESVPVAIRVDNNWSNGIIFILAAKSGVDSASSKKIIDELALLINGQFGKKFEDNEMVIFYEDSSPRTLHLGIDASSIVESKIYGYPDWQADVSAGITVKSWDSWLSAKVESDFIAGNINPTRKFKL